MSTHEIVILGGGMAAAGVAVQLLKTQIAKAAKSTGLKYRVNMISASSHFWYPLSVPLSIANPSVVPPEKIATDMRENMKQWAGDQFRFIHAEVTGVDFEKKTVAITSRDVDNAKGDQNVSYDSLIIATGSHAKSPIFKLGATNSLEESNKAIRDAHERIAAASTIVIAGGGPVGVETAGMIAHTFASKKKKIILATAGSRLLNSVKADLSTGAVSQLKGLGVDVKLETKVDRVDYASDDKLGAATVHLANGETLNADLYIDATGVIPNTKYLDAKYKDENNFMLVDADLGVTGAGKFVYAIGDVIPWGKKVAIDLQGSTPVLMHNWLQDQLPEAEKQPKKDWQVASAETMLVPIGKRGVGVVFGWRIWGFLVWLIKGRTFFIEMAAGGFK